VFSRVTVAVGPQSASPTRTPRAMNAPQQSCSVSDGSWSRFDARHRFLAGDAQGRGSSLAWFDELFGAELATASRGGGTWHRSTGRV